MAFSLLHRLKKEHIWNRHAIFRISLKALESTGGDEFVILLPEMDQNGAMAAVDRIRISMQAFNSGHEGPLVSISLGAATAATAAEIPGALKEADERMYADKVQRKQQRTD